MPNETKLHVLIAEDNPTDAELAIRELQKSALDFDYLQVDNEPDFIRALADFQPDIIICDYSMPQFDGLTAIRLQQQLAPLVPLIIHTGSQNEDVAVLCMKAGAADYVLKDRPARLGPAAIVALEHAREHRAHLDAQQRLVASERQFREMVETAYEGIWVVNEQQVTTFVNPRTCEMLGYTAGEMIGRNEYDFIPAGDIATQRSLEQAADCRTFRRFERRLLRKDGNILTTYMSVSPVTGPDGICHGTFAMLTDLTDRIKIETLRIEMERQTERTLRLASMSTLAAGISHEINQPLTVIKSEVDGYLIAGMAERQFDPREIADSFHIISEQIQRITNIIHHMRIMVKEPHEARKEWTTVENIVKSSLFFVQQQCRNHGISLEFFPMMPSGQILINPTALEQSLVNILQNAVQAMDSSSRADKRITIRESRTEHQVLLEILNNGPQIPLKLLPKIFDPFFTTKTNHQNMGLGLSIVANYIHALSGMIVCENADPEGVIFRITLPLGQVSGGSLNDGQVEIPMT